MRTKEEILYDKGITPSTQFHNYTYLYNSVIESMDEYADELVKTHLTQYTDFLLKEGYSDSDVYDEPPTAIDQYLAKQRKL